MWANGKLPLICLFFSVRLCGPQLVELYLSSLIHRASNFFLFLSQAALSNFSLASGISGLSSGWWADTRYFTSRNPRPQTGLREREVSSFGYEELVSISLLEIAVMLGRCEIVYFTTDEKRNELEFAIE